MQSGRFPIERIKQGVAVFINRIQDCDLPTKEKHLVKDDLKIIDSNKIIKYKKGDQKALKDLRSYYLTLNDVATEFNFIHQDIKNFILDGDSQDLNNPERISLEEDIQKLKLEKKSIEKETAEIKAKIDKGREALQSVEAKAKLAQENVEKSQAELQKINTQIVDLNKQKASISRDIQQAQEQLNETLEKLNTLKADVKKLEDDAKKLEKKVEEDTKEKELLAKLIITYKTQEPDLKNDEKQLKAKIIELEQKEIAAQKRLNELLHLVDSVNSSSDISKPRVPVLLPVYSLVFLNTKVQLTVTDYNNTSNKHNNKSILWVKISGKFNNQDAVVTLKNQLILNGADSRKLTTVISYNSSPADYVITYLTKSYDNLVDPHSFYKALKDGFENADISPAVRQTFFEALKLIGESEWRDVFQKANKIPQDFLTSNYV